MATIVAIIEMTLYESNDSTAHHESKIGFNNFGICKICSYYDVNVNFHKLLNEETHLHHRDHVFSFIDDKFEQH